MTDVPGLYFLGLSWQHTRGSASIGWVKDDAEFIAARIDASTMSGGQARAVTTPPCRHLTPTKELDVNEHTHHTATRTGDFPTDVAGLPEVVDSPVLELDDGDEVELRIAPAAKQIGDAKVRMLAYNGSFPGPTLRVHEGREWW